MIEKQPAAAADEPPPAAPRTPETATGASEDGSGGAADNSAAASEADLGDAEPSEASAATAGSAKDGAPHITAAFSHLRFFAAFFSPANAAQEKVHKKVVVHTTRAYFRLRIRRVIEATGELKQAMTLCEDMGDHVRGLVYTEVAKMMLEMDFGENEIEDRANAAQATSLLEDAKYLLSKQLDDGAQKILQESHLSRPPAEEEEEVEEEHDQPAADVFPSLDAADPLHASSEVLDPFHSALVMKPSMRSRRKSNHISMRRRPSVPTGPSLFHDFPPPIPSPRGSRHNSQAECSPRNPLSHHPPLLQPPPPSATSPESAAPQLYDASFAGRDQQTSPAAAVVTVAAAVDRTQSGEAPAGDLPGAFVSHPVHHDHAPSPVHAAFPRRSIDTSMKQLRLPSADSSHLSSPSSRRRSSIARRRSRRLSTHNSVRMINGTGDTLQLLRNTTMSNPTDPGRRESLEDTHKMVKEVAKVTTAKMWSGGVASERDAILRAVLVDVLGLLADQYWKDVKQQTIGGAMKAHYTSLAAKARQHLIAYLTVLEGDLNPQLAVEYKLLGDFYSEVYDLESARDAYKRATRVECGGIVRGVSFLWKNKLDMANDEFAMQRACIRVQAMFRAWKDRKLVEAMRKDEEESANLSPFEAAQRRRVLPFCRSCGAHQGGRFCAGCGDKLCMR
ncbi:hypothetical protein DIPPA_00821 [Diplonema papillatum]|nr:hypothetical protein DIPPA_00821 [Diplonema papillatum]